jgi:hypothetical protein
LLKNKQVIYEGLYYNTVQHYLDRYNNYTFGDLLDGIPPEDVEEFLRCITPLKVDDSVTLFRVSLVRWDAMVEGYYHNLDPLLSEGIDCPLNIE